MTSVAVPTPFLLRGSAWMLLLVLLAGATGCDDESSDAGDPTCGNGTCDSNLCESMDRCSKDCGTCVGAECTTGGTFGTCTEPCGNSCDCVNSAEFCTADYGASPGQCLPVTCLPCLHTCEVTPDSQGVCATGTCL
jgi:hypothetical protein